MHGAELLTCRDSSAALLQSDSPETLCRRRLSNRLRWRLHAVQVGPVRLENARACGLLSVSVAKGAIRRRRRVACPSRAKPTGQAARSAA